MGKKTKVVIDTNVIISAFGWSGRTQDIVDLVTRGAILNVTSFAILDELKRVAGYPKLGFPEELKIEMIETIYNASIIVSPHESLDVVDSDPDDNRILECASAGKVDCIITGDRHLLALGTYGRIAILTPDVFFEKWSDDK